MTETEKIEDALRRAQKALKLIQKTLSDETYDSRQRSDYARWQVERAINAQNRRNPIKKST